MKKLFSRNFKLDQHFPLIINMQSPQQATGIHSHEFDELVCVTKGKGTHFTENDSYEIIAGDVFIIRKGSAHGYRDTSNMHIANVLFHLDRLPLPRSEIKKLPGYHALFNLEPEFREKHRFEGRLRLSPDQLVYASSLIDKILAETTGKSQGYEFMATAYFMEFAGFLSRCYSKMQGRAYTPLIRLAEVIGHLENHLSDQIDINFLCRMAAMSRSTLFRAFKRSTGLTPIQYQMKLRISHAMKLLQGGNYSIKEVAFKTGFRDSNYFTRQFRSTTGVTPRQAKVNIK